MEPLPLKYPMLLLRTGCTYAIALLSAALLGRAAAHAEPSSAPVVPGFQVNRYEIGGDSVLDQATIDRATQSATGTNITAPQIRRALTKLQQAFRDRGYLSAAITLPRQPLTNGIIRLNVVPGPIQNEPAAPPITLPAVLVPHYNFQHFEIYGNTVLQPDEIDRLVSPAAGETAKLAQLEQALTKLQATYRERGYYTATVKLPQQVLTDGTVIIKVEEGLTLAAEEALATASAATNKPAPPRTFEVQRYDIIGNTLLPQAAIDAAVTNGLGTNITFTQVQKVMGELQLAFRERGFASAKVLLPQQQITNATITIQVNEGVLVAARVTGNRYFSSANVLRALPSLTDALLWKDQVVNSSVLQREVDLANQNRNRTIYPIINPGPEPGTSALELRVKDRFPLHAKVDVNNQNTPGTPDMRINTSANYGNLWQHEHQVGLSYGFTPEEFKASGFGPDNFLDRPLIANYGGFYRLPFGAASSVQQQVDSTGGRFGYDEATRQFKLPPAGARPDVTVYGSSSSSDTGVKFGAPSLVSQTPLLTIVSQDSGQNLTINDSAGGRLNVPLTLSETRKLSFSLGLDWKRYSLGSYNTNNFIITTVITNAQGSQTIQSIVSSPQPLRSVEFDYVPLVLGADYFQTDASGNFTASLGLSANFVGDDADFIRASYSPKAKADYAKATLVLTRDQTVFRDWSLLLRASGQVATGPLISNEQFALGGVNSVRGYYEGDEYGDTGWFGSTELRTPYITGNVPVWSGSAPVWLRGSVFFDVAQRYPLDTSSGRDRFRTLAGAGFTLSANINNRLDAKLVVGWPLEDSPNSRAGTARASISLGAQF